jgi:GNAT superfamily N-acetyltransferase
MGIQSAIEIRPAETGDAEPIAALLGELGYPQAPQVVCRRLEELAGFPSTRVLVALTDSGVVGVGTLNLIPLLHDHKIARVSALAVTDRFQGRGAGGALMRAFESIARDAGCPRLEVTSNLRRTGAHGFYERIGYEETSKRFVKWL